MDVLLRDSRFWVAVVLLLKTILFYFVPDFPGDIWAALDALVAVVLGVLAGRAARDVMEARRVQKRWQGDGVTR